MKKLFLILVSIGLFSKVYGSGNKELIVVKEKELPPIAVCLRIHEEPKERREVQAPPLIIITKVEEQYKSDS